MDGGFLALHARALTFSIPLPPSVDRLSYESLVVEFVIMGSMSCGG
jgi:hypothetical protein